MDNMSNSPSIDDQMVSASVPSSAPASPRAVEGAYFNRELSWLAFNERVLAEACNPAYPLLERLRFLSISGSNLDEFMMIRVAGLVGQAQRGIEKPAIDGRTPTQQLAAIREKLAFLSVRQQDNWRDLREQLADAKIHIADERRVKPAAHAWLEAFFLEEVLPVITPQALDPAHPFPFVQNEGMGLLFTLSRDADKEQILEMILIPSALPRFVRVPDEIAGPGDAVYISIASLIQRNAKNLFPGFTIIGDGLFRVLRDSDIEIEEEAEDLVRTFRSAIQRRRRGQVIQLEMEEDFDEQAEEILLEQLGVHEAAVIKTDGIIGIDGLTEIVHEDRPDLKFDAYSPRYPERIREHDGDAFSAIREKDIVIHHPYESFEAVVDFIRQAAIDPDVVAIKQTLYRAGSQSAVINALIEAAENGKSVTAVVEGAVDTVGPVATPSAVICGSKKRPSPPGNTARCSARISASARRRRASLSSCAITGAGMVAATATAINAPIKAGALPEVTRGFSKRILKFMSGLAPLSGPQSAFARNDEVTRMNTGWITRESVAHQRAQVDPVRPLNGGLWPARGQLLAIGGSSGISRDKSASAETAASPIVTGVSASFGTALPPIVIANASGRPVLMRGSIMSSGNSKVSPISIVSSNRRSPPSS